MKHAPAAPSSPLKRFDVVKALRGPSFFKAYRDNPLAEIRSRAIIVGKAILGQDAESNALVAEATRWRTLIASMLTPGIYLGSAAEESRFDELRSWLIFIDRCQSKTEDDLPKLAPKDRKEVLRVFALERIAAVLVEFDTGLPSVGKTLTLATYLTEALLASLYMRDADSLAIALASAQASALSGAQGGRQTKALTAKAYAFIWVRFDQKMKQLDKQGKPPYQSYTQASEKLAAELEYKILEAARTLRNNPIGADGILKVLTRTDDEKNISREFAPIKRTLSRN
ncbi:MAG: hypothetical protein IPL79_15995 [Myxococcales bacterium]|nr:hypothetical protein [Myxococcales bacterium]